MARAVGARYRTSNARLSAFQSQYLSQQCNARQMRLCPGRSHVPAAAIIVEENISTIEARGRKTVVTQAGLVSILVTFCVRQRSAHPDPRPSRQPRSAKRPMSFERIPCFAAEIPCFPGNREFMPNVLIYHAIKPRWRPKKRPIRRDF